MRNEKPTFYTVREEQGHGFYAQLLCHNARLLRKAPTVLGYFAEPGEASQEAKAWHGDREAMLFLAPDAFDRLVESGEPPSQRAPVGGECARCGTYTYLVCASCGASCCAWHVTLLGGVSRCLSCVESEVSV